MKPGPRPLPGIGKLSGSNKRNSSPPRPATSRPTPPKFLDRVALAEWKRIVPELEAAGLLTKLDRAALAGYCAAVSRLDAAERIIQRDGITSTTTQGESVAPAVRVAERALAQVRAFSAEFGLTPAARTRIEVKSAAPEESVSDRLRRTAAYRHLDNPPSGEF